MKVFWILGILSVFGWHKFFVMVDIPSLAAGMWGIVATLATTLLFFQFVILWDEAKRKGL